MGLSVFIDLYFFKPFKEEWKEISNSNNSKLFKCLVCNKHSISLFIQAIACNLRS